MVTYVTWYSTAANDSTDIMVPANPKEKCYEEDHTYVTGKDYCTVIN